MPDLSQGLVWVTWFQVAIIFLPLAAAMVWLEWRDVKKPRG